MPLSVAVAHSFRPLGIKYAGVGHCVGFEKVFVKSFGALSCLSESMEGNEAKLSMKVLVTFREVRV